ncbi:YdcH family protein [Acidithiobacillus sp. IBUN Pt1247-S3]|uniref:YdcH family protein n=1 Tax=Acidithiobacillus sp. IBUN Pt1247-S3 TaxID=3166642 RepID=UPI0034E5F8DD
MQTEHQDFATEFPELAQRIAELAGGNAHFQRRLEEFQELTARIEHIERNDALSDSPDLLAMKQQRLALKDELYQMATRG